MRIVLSEISSPPSQRTGSFSSLRKENPKKTDNTSDTREKLTSVNNSHDELFNQSSNISGSGTKKGHGII